MEGQLTLSQPGGGRADYVHHITTGTLGFSDLSTALGYTLLCLLIYVKRHQDQFTKKKLKLYPALRTLCNMIANFYCYYFSRQSEASTTTAAAVGSDVVMAEYNLDMGRWVCPTSNAEHSAISLLRFQVL